MPCHRPFSEFLKSDSPLPPARPEYFERQRKEWVEAVERLIAQCEKWIREGDQAGVLHLERHTITRGEYGLGTYEAPGLVVRLGKLHVEVYPIARNTFGPPKSDAGMDVAQGLVRMSDGLSRYDLYFYPRDGKDAWVIFDNTEGVASDLTRETFEQAMVNLLK